MKGNKIKIFGQSQEVEFNFKSKNDYRTHEDHCV